MLTFMTKETLPPAKKEPVLAPGNGANVDVLPDHPFVKMRRMLLESLGHLPTPLVMILMASLLAVVLTGLSMKFLTPKADHSLLPLRIEVDAAAPALDISRLQGQWTLTTPNGSVMGIRIKDTSFEWIVKPPKQIYERLFARGNLRAEGNVLVMGQRPDMGKPEARLEDLLDFIPLNLGNLNLKVEENGKLMVWILPESERRRLDRDFLSLFPPEADKPMTWVRMQ